MTPETLLQTRRPQWEALNQLLDKSKSGMNRLSPTEVNDLGNLYRAATSDLALAQRDFPRHQVTQYLNQLVARAHAVIYQDRPVALRRLWRFVTHGYPQLFRRTSGFFITALLLFFIPAIITGVLTAYNPEAARWTLPPQAQQLIPLVEQQELWIEMPVAERPYISSAIATNNIRVSFLAFAGGILAGLLTVYVMVFNGLNVGGLVGITTHYGVGGELTTFMVSHGFIELTVIFIAGGAGLMLGWAMLHPGLLSRRDAIMIAARQAVGLIIGAVPLLLIAGLIEGFISPADSIPPLFKWLFGPFTGVVLFSYLLLSGRGEKGEVA